MGMRAGSSVLQPIVHLSIKIKFRRIYVWNVIVYPHYNSAPRPVILDWVHSSLCCRINLSTGIIFCFLILGVSSQGWGTFLKEAGQGKDQRMGQGRLCLLPQDSPEQRTHPHRAKATGGRKRSLDFMVALPEAFLASFALFWGSPSPRSHKVWAPTFSRSEEDIWGAGCMFPKYQ